MRPDTSRNSESARVYLSLGSNVGDRAAQLRNAIARLGAAGRVVAESSLYETEPVEFTEQPWFLNCAVALETKKTPQQLMDAILSKAVHPVFNKTIRELRDALPEGQSVRRVASSSMAND